MIDQQTEYSQVSISERKRRVPSEAFYPVFKWEEQGYWEPQYIGGGTGLPNLAIANSTTTDIDPI